MRAFASVATSDGDLEFLAGLLDGTVTLDGLAVDTDLRWMLLRRLVSRGARGEEAIDAELSRDATDAGERHAASCRAAVPTLAAKRETWEALTDGKLTIAMFRATIIGFADPDQAELVEPYRREYFAALPTVWSEWSSAMAQDFVEYGYTIGAVDSSTIAATDAFLATEPAAARRAAPAAGRGPRRGRPRPAQPGPRPRGGELAQGASQGQWKPGHRSGCPGFYVPGHPPGRRLVRTRAGFPAVGRAAIEAPPRPGCQAVWASFHHPVRTRHRSDGARLVGRRRPGQLAVSARGDRAGRSVSTETIFSVEIF